MVVLGFMIDETSLSLCWLNVKNILCVHKLIFLFSAAEVQRYRSISWLFSSVPVSITALNPAVVAIYVFT
jgi:hypothetical protein